MLKCGWCSIYGVHDEAKDKEFELEMSWVCDESDRQFVRVRMLEPVADLFLPVQLTSSGVHESLASIFFGCTSYSLSQHCCTQYV